MAAVAVLAAGGLAVSVARAGVDGADAAPPDWLAAINAYRASASLSPVNEDETWSAQATKHAHYQVANGTVGVAPLPGDVISFDHPQNDGHVAVVAASSVDAGGNGSVTLLSQNDTDDGWGTIPVVGWNVRGFGQGNGPNTPYGWLHKPAGGVVETGRPGADPPFETAPRPDPPTAPPANGPRPPRP